MRCAKLRSLPYVSFPWLQTMLVILAQLDFPARSMDFCILKPRTFIWSVYGIFMTGRFVSQVPTGSACDFWMFNTAPVAFSYCCTASLIVMMSSGDVAKIVTSSAYATIAVFLWLCWIRIPWSCWSKRWSSGLRHRANSAILNGRPWRTEQCIGMGLDVFPLTLRSPN